MKSPTPVAARLARSYRADIRAIKLIYSIQQLFLKLPISSSFPGEQNDLTYSVCVRLKGRGGGDGDG